MIVAIDIMELWLNFLLKENLIHFCVYRFVGFFVCLVGWLVVLFYFVLFSRLAMQFILEFRYIKY